MNDFIKYIRDYSTLLHKGASWHNSKEAIAHVISDVDKANATDNYIYEFYCYICIIVDLLSNYEIEFIKGDGDYAFKFPQAAAEKKGKPRFHALKDGKVQFQICAGTKISGSFDSEQNHPDISFQLADSSDQPVRSDLIIILDAKFRENPNSKLSKGEVYTFIVNVSLFKLNTIPNFQINLNRLKDFYGNCLITNGYSYSNKQNVEFIIDSNIKEIENFYPGQKFNVLG